LVANTYIPERGDIIWLDFDPRLGHEQSGHRPALVVSPASYNGLVGLALVFPITRQTKNYAFEIELSGNKVDGIILADQIMNAAWRERGARLIEKAGPRTLSAAVERLMLLLD
jgi:mRNA interferase MazF